MKKENEKHNLKYTIIHNVFFYVGIFVFLMIFAMVVYEQSNLLKNNVNKVQTNLSEKQDERDSNNAVKKEYKTVVAKAAAGSEYTELVAEHPEVVTNPNLSLDIDEVNDSPSNVVVTFTGKAFTPANIAIRRGDLVTFYNPSATTIEITGNGWQSLSDIEPQKKYSQEFDVKGEYEYWVSNIANAKGVIIVE